MAARPAPGGLKAARPGKPHNTLAAYVLHRYDWSESSLILDLFTREQGRLAVVAKGAKRPYSQMRPVLLPFQRLQVSLGRAPRSELSDAQSSDIQNLRSAEWAGGPAMLGGAALFSGFYLNELLMKLLARHDPHPVLFDAYVQTLPCLGSADESGVQCALRAFECRLLQQLGVLPDLSLQTLTLEPVAAARSYSLLPEAGVGTARAADASVPGRVLVDLQAALAHGSVPALQQVCAKALPELKTLLRGLLHYHLGSPVLRTRQLMLELQALDR